MKTNSPAALASPAGPPLPAGASIGTTPSTPPAPGTNGPALEDLHPILDPVRIIDLRQILIATAITLVVLGLAAWLARLWWKRRQARLAEVPAGPPPLPAHERARIRLDEALQHLGDPVRFCTEHSVILREYIEERFGWNAPDRTTEEFLQQVQSRSELDGSHKELLQDFLTRCDFVKFARYEPTESELRALHQAAVRFVADTVPPPPPAGGPAGNPVPPASVPAKS